MKVFITGASGLIGRSTVKELVSHGHSVIGLARSEKAASTIKALGGTPHTGSLEDLESLKSGASQADASIHLGFLHDDFSEDGLEKAQKIDRAAITTIAEALSGAEKPLIIAAGTLTLPSGGLPDEDTESINDGSAFAQRTKASLLLLDLAKAGKVKGMVVRFAPTVHGPGDWGLIPMAVGSMKKAGEAIYVGDGDKRWCACHVEDAAVLLRLAIEKGRSGATYHAVGEQGVQLKAVAELVGRKTGLPVVSKQVPEAMEKLSFLGALLGTDNVVSSKKTQEELGWSPQHVGLLEDMDANYF